MLGRRADQAIDPVHRASDEPPSISSTPRASRSEKLDAEGGGVALDVGHHAARIVAQLRPRLTTLVRAQREIALGLLEAIL
jgi:hypothetical protein